MPTPSEKLAGSLERLKSLQDKDGAAAIRSRDLSRLDRERLLKNGFLKEVMKGWYVPASPDEQQGESTAWYASFWRFSAAYLEERFNEEWCLSPEQSLSLHAGNWTVPEQLVVRSPKSRNNVTALPHKTSLLEVRSKLPGTGETEIKDELRLFSLEAALIACSPGFYTQSPTDARAALSMVKDSSGLLAKLLDGGHSSIAGRLAGAFRNIGRQRIADEI
ncbi:MAG: cell filamentation protein Fic, partial [Alphaproteobacteria bacterium]